jgi:hypothetical protein
VLRVANELDFHALDVDVPLSSRAARNIVTRRAGPDGIDGDGDDVPYQSLAQLDAVPYVGPASLKAMLAYAEAAGWVTGGSGGASTDPFDPASCTGAPMTRAQALTYFAPAATEAALAPFHVQIRERSCNSVTGCAAWHDGTWSLRGWQGELRSEAPIDGVLDLSLVSGVFDLSPRASLCNPDEAITTCGDVSAPSVSCTAPSLPLDPRSPCTGSNTAQLGTTAAPLAGIVTDHCTRLSAHAADAPDENGTYTEYEAVLSSTYGTSACQPLTCAAAGKTCGTMPDGCGGTLECGTCGAGSTCSNNVCEPLPCGGTCGAGRVCCYDPLEGHDDCFDACS